jgi:small subunit ribosomal protein S8
MDPIGDMLTAILNAQKVKKETLKIPFSKIKLEIAKILKREGYIEEFEEKGRYKKSILIHLKYDEEGKPGISGVKKISKPGQRIYKGYLEIKRVKGGYGIAIISTSKGLMTDKEARKKKIGGEVICEVW